jgi:hypothetical protein
VVRPASAFLVAVVFLGFLGGCGYRVVSYPERADVVGVAIQNFDNESFDYGYEMVLADALRKEFARRGAWKLVNDPERAEMVIDGSIRPINTGRRSFSSVVSTLEYEVGVLLRVNVQRPGDVQLGVDSRILRERELYLASADVEVTRRNRDEALRRVANVLAQRVHDVLYEVAPPPVGVEPPAAPTPEVPGDPDAEPRVPGQLPPLPLPEPAESGVESERAGEGADWVYPGRSPRRPFEADDPLLDEDVSE